MKSKRVNVRLFLLAALALACLQICHTAAAQGPPPILWMQGGDGETIAFSPDGSKMAVGENGYLTGALVLWDRTLGQVIQSFPTSANGVSCVAFSPDGNTIALGGYAYVNSVSDGVLELWTVSTGIVATLPVSASGVVSVAFSSDGTTLAVGGTTGTAGVLQLWNVAAKTLSVSFPTSATNGVLAVALSADSKMLAAGGSYLDTGKVTHGVLELWNISAKSVTKFPTNASNGVLAVALTADGNTLVAGGSYSDDGGNGHGVLELWRAKNGNPIQSLKTSASSVNAVVCTSDSLTLAAGGSLDTDSSGDTSGTLELWSLSSPYSLLKALATQSYDVTSVAISSDNSTLAVAGEGALETWSLATETLSADLGTGSFAAFAAISFDGKTIAASGGNGSLLAADGSSATRRSVLQLWDTETGTFRSALQPSASLILPTAFSPDGTILAAGGTMVPGDDGYPYSGVLQLWNTATGDPTTLNTTLSWVDGLAFSPDGKWLAATGDTFATDVIELWNVLTSPPTPTTFPSNQAGRNVAFSPDGNWLVVGCEGGLLELYYMSSGQLTSLQTLFNDPKSGPSVHWSADSKSIYAFGSGKDINGVFHPGLEVWDYAAKTYTSYAIGGPSKVKLANAAALSPDGTTMFFGTDQALLVYRTANWSLIKSYSEEIGGGIISIAFPGTASTQYVIGRQDGTIVLANNPYAVAVQSLVLTPANVTSGATVQGLVTLSTASPIGATVNLTPAGIGMPATVLVPAGTSSATFTFTVAHINSAESVTVTAAYNGTSASASLNVAGVPTANAQTFIVPHNTVGDITLTGTDLDIPALALTFAIISKPANGTLGVLNKTTGAVTYTPKASYQGTDTFTFSVSNGTNTSAAATVTLKVAPGVPIGNAQTVTVAHSTAIKITLTGSDPDVPVLPLTFELATNPSHGVLGALNASTGVVTYTPDSNYDGTDSFTFTVDNGTNTSVAAKVTLNVAAGTPTANAQTVAVAHGTAKSITLTGTDPDSPALPLTFAIVGKPAHGVLGTLNATTGVVEYTPTSTYSGTDSFTFTAGNKTNKSAAATVTLNVAAGTPKANAQTIAVSHNTATSVSLTGTDPDVPALALSFAIVSKPANGTLGTLNKATGAVTYTPKASFQGTDTFTFTVNNGTNTSAAATVTLKVAPGTPTANAQTVTVVLNTAIKITLTGTDPDVPALPLTFAIVTKPLHGVLGTLNASTGVVTYTPDSKYDGTDTFTFTVSNGTNKSAAATVTLKVGGG